MNVQQPQKEEQSAQYASYDWDPSADVPVGEVMRRARVHYGLELHDVEAALRIRSSQLAAMEQGRTDLLPGRVYALGFVRTYAEYLGLDGNRMVHLFKTQETGRGGTAKPELHFPVPATESKAPGPVVLAVSFFVLALVLSVYVYWSLSRRAMPEEIPPVPPRLAGAANAPGTASPGEMAAASKPLTNKAAANKEPAPESRIVIKATGTAWVEIRDGAKKSILSRIFNAGDSYSVPDLPGLTLDTGNAGALDFVVDGKAVPRLGEEGDIRRGVKLDADKMVKPEAVSKSGRNSR